MTQILNKKVAGFDIQDLAVIGITKFAGEMILSRFVGDANIKSAFVKFVLGGLLTKVNRNMAIGVALDGVEDAVIGTGIRDALLNNIAGDQQNEGGWT